MLIGLLALLLGAGTGGLLAWKLKPVAPEPCLFQLPPSGGSSCEHEPFRHTETGLGLRLEPVKPDDCEWESRRSGFGRYL